MESPIPDKEKAEHFPAEVMEWGKQKTKRITIPGFIAENLGLKKGSSVYVWIEVKE